MRQKTKKKKERKKKALGNNPSYSFSPSLSLPSSSFALFPMSVEEKDAGRCYRIGLFFVHAYACVHACVLGSVLWLGGCMQDLNCCKAGRSVSYMGRAGGARQGRAGQGHGRQSFDLRSAVRLRHMHSQQSR